MNDYRGIEFETAPSPEREWRRRPPEMLLPLMRSAQPSPAAVRQPVPFGRMPAVARPSRWNRAHRQASGPGRSSGTWPLSIGKSER